MMILYAQCGLGNQMFQYAYVKYLESKGHDRIWIDSSAPSMRKHNGFELRKIFPKIGQRGRFMPYFVGRTLHLLSDILKKGFGHTLETEDTGKLWLRGYWQESTYADCVREELLKDYEFCSIEDTTNKSILKQIESTNSVSIHIRRGDYLSASERVVFGDICHVDYYKKAIGYIRDHVSNPIFFVFSNDMEWVSRHFELPEAVFVENNTGVDSFRDMQLMSRCKHNIIANSSFSWWGAWLNTNPDCVILSPAKWFHNFPAEFNDKIVPHTWHRIGEPNCNVSLIVDFELSESDLSMLQSQSYMDFELIKLSDVAKGNHRFELTKEEMAEFKDKKYLENKLIAYFKTL